MTQNGKNTGQVFWLLWNYMLIWKSEFLCHNNAHITTVARTSKLADQFKKYSESYSCLSSHVYQPSFLLNLQSSTNDSEESSQQSRLSMPKNMSEFTFLHGLKNLYSDCSLLPSFRFLRKLNWSFFKRKNSLDNCLRIRVISRTNFLTWFPILKVSVFAFQY